MQIIKLFLLSIILACTMTVGALAYLTQVERCQVIVLHDIAKHNAFYTQLSQTAPQPVQKDFLTTITSK